jgi:hypothetical protein
LLGHIVNDSGETSEVTIDTTITNAPVGTHTVAISNDTGILASDRITNDSVVKVSLTLGNNLVLASDEMLHSHSVYACWYTRRTSVQGVTIIT